VATSSGPLAGEVAMNPAQRGPALQAAGEPERVNLVETVSFEIQSAGGA